MVLRTNCHRGCETEILTCSGRNLWTSRTHTRSGQLRQGHRLCQRLEVWPRLLHLHERQYASPKGHEPDQIRRVLHQSSWTRATPRGSHGLQAVRTWRRRLKIWIGMLYSTENLLRRLERQP